MYKNGVTKACHQMPMSCFLTKTSNANNPKAKANKRPLVVDDGDDDSGENSDAVLSNNQSASEPQQQLIKDPPSPPVIVIDDEDGDVSVRRRPRIKQLAKMEHRQNGIHPIAKMEVTKLMDKPNHAHDHQPKLSNKRSKSYQQGITTSKSTATTTDSDLSSNPSEYLLWSDKLG